MNDLFQISKEEIESLFDCMGQTILINDIEKQAIITNPQFSKNEERFISTLENVAQGSIVLMDNEKFLVVSESVTKRHSKYKVKVKHCNYTIEIEGEIERVIIGYDDYGRPEYQEIQGDPIFIPCITENKSFSIDGYQLLVADNTIIVVVQDNEVNLEKFSVNIVFGLWDKQWKVRNQDRTRKGLLILTCERTT
ncbi:hypothetical protein [Heyndrickxia oleronia]|jgi:hypothetical protein|uniref:hypothetical protein n=1 Tax=Heyndrickxia oleronia TaxID=38875 RepID=UPI0024316DBB|nr:hypothetical protein [Heyndrickxia oleronia]MCI1590129.1 hypothetical protein [Heyndrickxia oleronia]MCI1613219.1 hypothetical protein [Heyndrickxia oleronia]MCI1744546.1 hypothetical protein [Heyndrickxia oleronia]MCI1761169.1 hypothetical protein [Heyndrickxia oleronia]